MAPGVPEIPVWKNAPFLRIVFPFLLGILMQWELPIRFPWLISFSGLCVIAYLYLNMSNVAVLFRFRKASGVLLHLLLLFSGMICVRQHDIRNNKNWLGHAYRNSDWVCIRIDQPPLERKNRYKISGTVTALVSEGQWKKVQGRVLVYLKRDSSCPPPACGEIWLIKKALQPIRNSGNPGAFNYRQYAAFRDIHHRVMLDTSERIVVGWQNPGWLNNFLYAARNHILHSLQKNLEGSGSSYGIAAALLIGYTEELDQEVLDSYSHTGVVHIIAVSGMHLGLIYLLLNRIFTLLPFLRNNRSLQSLLRIAGLWLFALLTGASASVCRAAVMFTLMDLGGLSGKSSAGLNALAASAFLLLLYHPFHLWDIGFQLSYLAVAGIMLFQAPLYRLIPLQNRMLDEVWKLSAVSVAAQLLTFPVCLLYFHQFPNLFLPANLLAVPLSAFAIYTGIALVVFGNVPIAAVPLAWLVDTLIGLMNRWIGFIDRSPLSVWEQVPANVATTVLLYAFIISSGVAFLLRKKAMLMGAVVSFFLLIMAYRVEAWKRERRQCVWVFDIGGQRAVYFIRGNRYRYRGDAAPLMNAELNRFHLKPAHAELVLSDTLAPLYRPVDSLPLYVFCGKKILFIENSWKFNVPHKKLAVDLVVLSRNARMSIRKIDSAFASSHYVADASNGLWKTEQWENECEELHLPCHVIQKKGAFHYDTE